MSQRIRCADDFHALRARMQELRQRQLIEEMGPEEANACRGFLQVCAKSPHGCHDLEYGGWGTLICRYCGHAE